MTVSIAESNGTVELDDLAWKKAVALRSAVAQLKMTDPAVRKRLEPATALATDRSKIRYGGDGIYLVNGKGDALYQVGAQFCECEDFAKDKAPKGWCKHRLGVMLRIKAAQLTPAQLTLTPEQLLADLAQHEAFTETPPADPPPVPEEEPPPDTDAGLESPEPPTRKRTVPARYIQKLQGKNFVRFVGLLAMAQEEGLVELRAVWTHNDAELSLAHAVAIFEDGRRYEESGDSTPQNAKNIGLHWRRMSLTRAKARALRDALGVEEVSIEEME